jgi:hypothetical protein
MMKLAATLKRSADREVLQECKALLQRCVAGFTASPTGPTSENCLWCMNSLAGVLDGLGRADEAEALYRETLAQREVALGKHHPVKREREAGRLYTRTARARAFREGIARHAHVPSAPRWHARLQDTMITVNNLALLLESKVGTAAAGSEADQMYRRALPFTPRD